MVPRRTTIPVAALLIAVVTACAPTPAPTPTPSPTSTGFASEEAAFAAAEDTFREYINAANAVDLADPTTFEATYAWTTGDEYVTQREQLTQMHSLKWTLSGVTTFDGFKGVDVNVQTSAVTALVCLDVSDVTMVDETGASVVPPDRPPRQAHELEFLPASHTDTGLLVSRVNRSEAASCAP